ncbi:MAG: hypothetical protein R6V05_12395, partial [Candidatus Brocadiia bacterium]
MADADPRERALWCVALAVGLCWAAVPVAAVDVWMPETGQVTLEEPVSETAEGRLQHAYALV